MSHEPPTQIAPRTEARAPRVARDADRDQSLQSALTRFAAAAVRRDEVDSVTTELVRMRCATFHDCHL